MSDNGFPPRPGPPFAQTGRPGTRSPQRAAMRSRRLRRRALLLLLPVPLLLAALVLGTKLAFLPVIASYASGRYDAKDFTEAATNFGFQKTMNVVDPWKAWFNTGTALHRSGDDVAAISDLHRAWELAEDEEPMVRCRIQVNLSISYETSGDFDKTMADEYLAQKEALEEALAARDAGQDYNRFLVDPEGDGTDIDPQDLQDEATTWFAYAERSYATAEQVRGWPGCEDQSEQEQEQNQESTQRLQDKQQQAKDAQPEPDPTAPETPEDQGETPDGADQSEQERAEAERQEKLQQQNSEARDDEEQSRQEYEEYFGGEDPEGNAGDGGGSSKNW